MGEGWPETPVRVKVRPGEGKLGPNANNLSTFRFPRQGWLPRLSPVEVRVGKTNTEEEIWRLWGHSDRCSLLSLIESFKLGKTLGHLGRI